MSWKKISILDIGKNPIIHLIRYWFQFQSSPQSCFVSFTVGNKSVLLTAENYPTTVKYSSLPFLVYLNVGNYSSVWNLILKPLSAYSPILLLEILLFIAGLYCLVSMSLWGSCRNDIITFAVIWLVSCWQVFIREPQTVGWCTNSNWCYRHKVCLLKGGCVIWHTARNPQSYL